MNQQINQIGPDVLTPEQLDGKIPVRICNVTRENRVFEGMGIILEINQGDRCGVHAKVDIDGDIVERWIFAKDQNPHDEIETKQKRDAIQLKAANQFGMLQDTFHLVYHWFKYVFGEPELNEYDAGVFFEWVARYQKGFVHWFGKMDQDVKTRTMEFLLNHYQIVLPDVADLKDSLLQARCVIKARDKAIQNHIEN